MPSRLTALHRRDRWPSNALMVKVCGTVNAVLSPRVAGVTGWRAEAMGSCVRKSRASFVGAVADREFVQPQPIGLGRGLLPKRFTVVGATFRWRFSFPWGGYPFGAQALLSAGKEAAADRAASPPSSLSVVHGLIGWTREGKELRLRVFVEGSSPHAGRDRVERLEMKP